MDPELGDYGMPTDASYLQAPPEFTQAHALQLNKLQQADAEADNQLFSGEISQGDHAQWKQIIGGQLAPLRAMQQASQQQQQQEAMGQAQQQAAFAEGIDHSNAVFRAQGIQDRIATYTDPLTAETIHLIEDGRGKWRELQFPGQEESGEPPADADYLGQTQDTAADSGTTTAQPPRIEPQPDGGHVMTIINGNQQERWHFAPDGTTTKLPDAQGQAPAQQMSLSQAEMATLRERARRSVPMPQQTGNPRLDSPRLLQWQKAVDALASHFASVEMKGRLQQQQQGAIAGRQQSSQDFQERQTQEKEQQRKDHEAAQKDQKETQKARSDQFLKFYDLAAKHLTTKDDSGKPVKPSHEQVMGRVKELLKEHDAYLHPEQQQPEAPKPAEAPKQTTWQWLTGQKPPAPAPAPEGKGRTQDFEAYIRKTLGETAEGRKELQRNDLRNVMQGVSGGNR